MIVEFIICPMSGLFSIFHTTEYIITTAIFSFMTLQYFLCSTIITNRFLMLNKILVEENENLRANRPNAIIYKFKLFLENVMDVHDQLSTITRKLNDYYAFQLLIALTVLCSLIIVNGYVILYSMTLGFSGELFYIIYPGFKFILLHTVQMLLIIVGSSNVCNQVKQCM